MSTYFNSDWCVECISTLSEFLLLKNALQPLFPFVLSLQITPLSISGFMLGLDAWCFDLATFLVVYMGSVAVDAQQVLVTITQ